MIGKTAYWPTDPGGVHAGQTGGAICWAFSQALLERLPGFVMSSGASKRLSGANIAAILA